MRFDKWIAAAALAATSFAATETGAVEVKSASEAQEIKLAGRLHTQFNSTSVDGEPGSEFLVRRARFVAEVKLNDFVSGKVEPEYGAGTYSLKDGYMELSIGESYRVKFGQFKRSFDLFQLTSSTRGLVIERGLAIRGVHGLRTYSSLSEKLQYSDRDIGFAGIYGNKSRPVSASFMVSNGIGANKVPSDEEEGFADLQYSGRIELDPVEGRDLTVAFNGSYRPYLVTTTVSSCVEALDGAKRGDNAPAILIESEVSEEYSLALGFDVDLGNYTSGPHVKAGLIRGENWAIDSFAGPDTASTDSTRIISVVNRVNADAPPTFIAGQIIATYKLLIAGNDYVEAIEPIVRVSYADPNDDISDDGGILITPGFQTFFTGRNKISFNLDLFFPESDDEKREYSFKAQTYLNF